MNTTPDIKAVFTNIYKNDLWNMGQSESKSGLGSTEDFTKKIQKKIIEVVNEYNIKSLLDTSCGDLNWMRKVLPLIECEYLGIDVVESVINENKKLCEGITTKAKISFKCCDFLSHLKTLPDKSVDLILCRHTCEHLPTEYVIDFINEAKRVAKFLLLTTHRNARSNVDLTPTATPYRPINLNIPPYSSQLEHHQIDSFYDGATSRFVSEMFINLYKF